MSGHPKSKKDPREADSRDTGGQLAPKVAELQLSPAEDQKSPLGGSGSVPFIQGTSTNKQPDRKGFLSGTSDSTQASAVKQRPCGDHKDVQKDRDEADLTQASSAERPSKGDDKQARKDRDVADLTQASAFKQPRQGDDKEVTKDEKEAEEQEEGAVGGVGVTELIPDDDKPSVHEFQSQGSYSGVKDEQEAENARSNGTKFPERALQEESSSLFALSEKQYPIQSGHKE